ncbi:MAG: chorismate-binding protein, partial [Paludibacteraceae bacterium]|nr:chorismate-binding protein [Paludibacteraceae bacterium]
MNECAKRNIPFLFAFNFELNEALFIEDPSSQTEILFQTTLGGNSKPATALTKKTDNISFRSEPVDDYERRFNIVKQALQRGDSFLVNLTSRTPVSTNLSIKEIFDSTDAPYRLYVPERFVCFSPERFVLIQEDGTISTDPMKGTIDASLPNAEEAILSNPKETAEHATVVDLLRNDISMNASNVHVARYRYITLIKGQEKSILQVSSEIKGQLS